MANDYSPIQPYNPNSNVNVPTATGNTAAPTANQVPPNAATGQNMATNQNNYVTPPSTEATDASAGGETEYYSGSGDSLPARVVTRVRENPLLAGIILLVFLGLIAFGVLLLSLGSGGGQPSDTDDSDTGGVGNTVFLQMWGMFLDEEVISPLIEEYESLNPNVTIDYANKQGIGARENTLRGYQNELNRVFTSNDPAQQPDIFMVQNNWGGDYEPFSAPNPFFTLESYSQTFYTAAIQDHAFTGEIYGVPAWMDTYAILYNRDILQASAFTEPPSTWPEFKNLANSLATDEVGGFAAGYSENTDFAADMYLLLMLQNGVNLTNSEGVVNFAASPEAVSALEFLQSFRNEDIWNTDFENASAEFLRGNVAMIAAPTWRLRDILTFNDSNNLGIDIGVAQMPQIPGQDQELYNWATYWSYMVNAERPNAVAAWEFISWINEPEQQTKLSNNVENTEGYFGLLYARKDMVDSLAEEPLLSVYAESLPFAESFYQVKGLEVEEELERLIDTSSASSSSINGAQSTIRELIANRGILNGE